MDPANPLAAARSLARFRRHLALGVALLLTLVAGSAALVLRDSRRTEEAGARQAAANAAQTLALNVASRLQLADATLRATLMQLERLQRHGALTAADTAEILRSQQALVPELSTLQLADAQGATADGGSVAGQDWFRAARGRPAQLAVSEPRQGAPNPGCGLVLARARHDVGGRFAGVAYVGLPSDSFTADFQRANLGPRGAATLRTGTLHVVARHVPQDGGGAQAALGSAQVSPEMRAALVRQPARGSLVTHSALDGVERVVAYEAVPGYPLLMQAALSTEEFFADWRHDAAVFIVPVLGLMALLTAAAWFVERAHARQVQARHQIAQLAAERGALLDNELVPMVRLRERREVWHNRAMAELFGYAPGELAGQSARVFYPDDDAFERAGKGYRRMPASGRFRAQLKMARKDGSPLWIDLSGTQLPGGESLWMMLDITTVKTREQEARHLALHDALTGLPNRHLLHERLGFLLRDAARRQSRLAVCYLDLDGFKAVNDRHGHDAGDALLRAVAQRLRETLRGNDVVARIGGDEFVVVLTHLATTADEGRAVERLHQCFDGPFTLPGGGEANVGASLGVARYPQHAEDAARLLTLADQAMLAGKRAGKGRWVLHEPGTAAGAPGP